MEMIKRKREREYIWIGMLLLIGGIIRIICCFWGWPHQYHADEHTIIEGAMDMLSRHSWEAFVYNRPDHFEIKCDAVIFSLVSWVKYKAPAYEMFELHKKVFYFLGRLFTCFWGIALIPLSYAFILKLTENKKNAFLAGFFVTFSPIFVQHSAYATPDIPLAFFVLLTAYFSIYYIRNDRFIYLAGMCCTSGIAVTIKYPAALCCVYIAVVVIYKAYKERESMWINILKRGAASVAIVLVCMFVIAPNLFTDITQVVTTLKVEARNTHVGADGLGKAGNIFYYLQTICGSMGYISIVLFGAGVYNIWKKYKTMLIPLSMFVIYWLGLSMMALHWERWGIPMYLGYIYCMSVGIYEALEWGRGMSKYVRVAVSAIIGIIACNVILSAVIITFFSVQTDTRTLALEYCEKNNITAENSIGESYTPFHESGGGILACDMFDSDNGRVILKDEYQNKDYLIISTSYLNRFLAEPTRYLNEIECYDSINKTYKLEKEFKSENNEHSSWSLINIYDNLRYMATGKKVTGNDIYIYELQ